VKDANTGERIAEALGATFHVPVASDAEALVLYGSRIRAAVIPQCSRCERPSYAHGLCHRCWCREGLELDNNQKPATTPSVPPGAKQRLPWQGRQGIPVTDEQET
jgi:hypothetical protein